VTTLPSKPNVLLERPSDAVALATLNRPAARNALIFDSWHELAAVLDRVESDPQIRCLVIAGAGSYFSSGGDLKSAPAAGFRATAAVARLEIAQRVLLRIRRSPLPILAAVEGGAVGLGWSLALSCDLVIAASSATFSAPFVARGVVPDGGAAWLLVRRIGSQRAAELLLSGRAISAEEAHRLGLVNRVVDAGTASRIAVEFAESLPHGMPQAMELTKRLIGAADSLDLRSYFELECMVAAICQGGPEAQRARQAFQDRAAVRSASPGQKDKDLA
jgi:enoyl-CoA hydratase/carnithine racemase